LSIPSFVLQITKDEQYKNCNIAKKGDDDDDDDDDGDDAGGGRRRKSMVRY
jgi:hypothetical protein